MGAAHDHHPCDSLASSLNQTLRISPHLTNNGIQAIPGLHEAQSVTKNPLISALAIPLLTL